MLHLSLEHSVEIPGISGKERQRPYLRILGPRAVTAALLLLVLPFPRVRPQVSPHVCPEESRDGIVWPETGAVPGVVSRVSSTPLCLSEDLSLVTRTCVSDGEDASARWEPALPPPCAHLHPTFDDTDKCPPPFRNLSDGPVCAHVGDAGSWDRAINTCFLSGTSKSILDLDERSFGAVLHYLRKELWSDERWLASEAFQKEAMPQMRSVWLDGRRNKALTPIVRKLPGDFQRMGVLWAQLSNGTVPWAAGEPSLSPEKQCLAMEVPRDGSPSLRMEPCYSRRPAACAFVPPSVDSPLLSRLACPEGYVTSLYQGEQHRCFRIVRDREEVNSGADGRSLSPADRCSASGDTLMRLSSAHVNALFVEMAKANGLEEGERCLIGLNRKGKRFVWGGESGAEEKEINYVNWYAGTDFEKGEVGTARGDGRWDLVPCRETLSVGCVACERAAQVPPRARLTLRLHPPSGRLLLSVYSGEGLWRYGGSEPVACFSDGHFGLARRLELGPPVRDGRWSRYNLRGLQPELHPGLDLSKLHKTVFVLPTTLGELARYWCEARRVVGLRPLSTDKVWNANMEKGKFVFSLALEAVGVCSGDLGVRDCEPTFGSKHYEVAVDLRRRMHLRQGSIKPVRILSVTNGNLCLLLHVTIKTRLADNETTSESMLEHGTYLRLMALVSNTVKDSEGKYEFLWLRSTRGCIQSYSSMRTPVGLTELHWDACPLGYSAVSRELCLQTPNGSVPVIRTCRGDYMFGGIWDPPSGVCSDQDPPELTRAMHALMIEVRLGGNASAAVRKASVLSSEPSALSSADIHFLAMTMRGVAASAATLRADADLGIVTSVIDHIMRARRENVALSQRLLNSTNVLLDAIDDIFGEMILGEGSAEREEGGAHGEDGVLRIGGVYAAVTSQVAVQVSDVSRGNNVTGVALVRRSATSDYALGRKSEADDSETNSSGFKRYSLLPLTSEQPLESLFDLQPEVAVLLPIEMLPGGESYFTGDGNASASTRVVTTLFYSDLPFKPAEGGSVVSLDSDEDDEDDHEQDDEDDDEDDDDDDEVYGEQVNSRVINIWTPGLGPDLPAPVPILFRPLRPVQIGAGRQCAHWDFSASSWGGGWASDGCFFAGTISTGMDVCICTHLTHFAELLFPLQLYVDGEHPPPSAVLLDVISVLGCALSLLGVAGIVATALVFRRWRHRLGSKVLLHLTGAIGLEMTVFLAINASSFTNEDVAWCMTLGIALHYSIISTFCWMLLAALLQYLRFVRIIGDYRPPRFLLKASVFAWGFPLIPVVLVLSVDGYPYGVDLSSSNSSLPSSDGFFCYPTGLSLALGVVLPVALVIIANICVYVLILRSILVSSGLVRNTAPPSYGTPSTSTAPNGSPGVTNGVISKATGRPKSDEREHHQMAVRHLRWAFLLFFLLGLSWIFGIFARISKISVFSYLFCATATMQGFVLFIFYVVGDPNTRQLWVIKIDGIMKPFRERCKGIPPSPCCRTTSADDDPSCVSSAVDVSCYQSSRSSSLSG